MRAVAAAAIVLGCSHVACIAEIKEERGYGAALRRGFREAQGRYMVMGDCDGTYEFSQLDALIAPLDEGYDLVMLGAPLYSGRWHRDAHRFLNRHREELGRVPVWVFGMGARSGSPEAWRRARFQLDRALAKRAWLQPIASTVFGGVDPPDTDGVRRDLRDWDEIHAWASDVSRSIAAGHKQPL